jgi:hypothetical protein
MKDATIIEDIVGYRKAYVEVMQQHLKNVQELKNDIPDIEYED